MRDLYLGDSLDMSKRATVSLLRNVGFSLCICPLPSQREFTDAVYRSCLGLSTSDRIFNPPVRFRSIGRARHLEALREELSTWGPGQAGIALLDPDKGVHDSRRSNLFVTVGEINALLEIANGPVIAIYHHRNAGSISCSGLLERLIPRPAVAYRFGAAILLFAHTEVAPLRKISNALVAELNAKRIELNQVLRSTA